MIYRKLPKIHPPSFFAHSSAYAPTIPCDAVTFEVNNHDDSSDFPEERPAASLSVHYGRRALCCDKHQFHAKMTVNT